MATATLGTLIARLEQEPDPSRRIPLGFAHPHSYRGYYEELAFEPAEDAGIAAMLNTAKSCIGRTFQGYKGGHYTMDEWSTVWLAQYGDTGETLGPWLLEFMLANGTQDIVTQLTNVNHGFREG